MTNRPVQVKTTAGWQDLAIQGPQGSQGPAGDPGAAPTRILHVVMDGEGLVIPTGIAGDVFFDVPGTISKVTLLADQVGWVVVDIWKDVFANFPPTIADSITASAKPSLSNAQSSSDSALIGWTKSIAAGDCLRFNVDSVTAIQRLTLALTIST